jgi:hypothetical protein
MLNLGFKSEQGLKRSLTNIHQNLPSVSVVPQGINQKGKQVSIICF